MCTSAACLLKFFLTFQKHFFTEREYDNFSIYNDIKCTKFYVKKWDLLSDTEKFRIRPKVPDPTGSGSATLGFGYKDKGDLQIHPFATFSRFFKKNSMTTVRQGIYINNSFEGLFTDFHMVFSDCQRFSPISTRFPTHVSMYFVYNIQVITYILHFLKRLKGRLFGQVLHGCMVYFAQIKYWIWKWSCDNKRDSSVHSSFCAFIY
jgi:hypothetical protein